MQKSRSLRHFASAGDEQKSDGEQRAYDVRVKRDSCVAWCEVPGNQHLSDMSYGVAEQKEGGGADCRRLEAQSRQKEMQAVTPIARSAMPTSNWNGLTSQPIRAAAVTGRNT